MRKPSPQEVLRSIEEEETPLDDQIGDELDAVLAMTPEERRKELEAAGFDPKSIGAGADALRAALAVDAPAARKDAEPPSEVGAWTKSPETSPRPTAGRRRRYPLLTAAALAVLLLILAAVFVVGSIAKQPPPPPAPSSTASPPPGTVPPRPPAPTETVVPPAPPPTDKLRGR